VYDRGGAASSDPGPSEASCHLRPDEQREHAEEDRRHAEAGAAQARDAEQPGIEQRVRRLQRTSPPSFPPTLWPCSWSRQAGTSASFRGASPSNTARLSASARFHPPRAWPEIEVRQLWHVRLDADPGQRWLRDTIRGALG
jgi:hypothetical protein